MRTCAKRFLSIAMLTQSIALKSVSDEIFSGSLVRNCARWMKSRDNRMSSYIFRIPEIEEWGSLELILASKTGENVILFFVEN